MAGLEKDVWVRPHRPSWLHTRHQDKRNQHETHAASRPSSKASPPKSTEKERPHNALCPLPRRAAWKTSAFSACAASQNSLRLDCCALAQAGFPFVWHGISVLIGGHGGWVGLGGQSRVTLGRGGGDSRRRLQRGRGP
jgi:hypothetical protein